MDNRLRIRKKAIVCCAVLCCNAIYYSKGNDNYPLGARSAGLATASVMLTDIWSAANNQAGLGYLEHAAVSFYYENRLNVKGLSIQAGTIAFPMKSTVIGVNYRYFGFSKYNDSKFGLAVAKKLGEKFSIGVQMDYFHTHFAYDYGNFHTLSAEVGLLCEPVDNLKIGAHAFNISQTRQNSDPNGRMPTIVRFGAGYTIGEKATICLETEKNLKTDAIFKGGLEFVPVKNLSLRCGVSTGLMNQYAFGLGYLWRHLNLDIAFSHHKFLGYSPQISIIASL